VINLKRLLVFLLLLSILLGFIACNARKSEGQAAHPAGAVSADVFAGHENDSALVAEIYPVSKENPFIIAGFEELLTHLKFGTGVVAFGFPECPRCDNAFPALEKAFNKMNMARHAGFRGKIVYYDFYDDRETNNDRYRTLIEYLKDFLPVDSDGNPRLYSPDIFFIASGKILGNHLDTVPSLANPRDPLNEEQEGELIKIYMDLIAKVEDCGC